VRPPPGPPGGIERSPLERGGTLRGAMLARGDGGGEPERRALRSPDGRP
jgi:hypothetical protein